MFEDEDLEDVYRLYSDWARDIVSYLRRFASHAVVWLAAYVCVCVVLYWRRATRKRSVRGAAAARRALLVLAHPDDECMFFGPTVHGLLEQAVNVYVLCLSDGNNDGSGVVRRGELRRACVALGIPAANVCLVSDPRLPDCPRTRWPAPVAARLVLQQLEMYDIDTLITFDKHGVSGHTNHSSLFYAVAYLFVENKLPQNCSVYTLDSVNIIRKYWSFLDLPLSQMLSSEWYFLSWRQSKRIVRAMKQHQSQMVWFRRLYVIFSRYMVINTLRKITLVDVELELTVDED